MSINILPIDDPEDPEAFTSITYKKKTKSLLPHSGTKKRGNKGKARERTVGERIESRRLTFVESGYLEKCRDLLRKAIEVGPIASTSQLSLCPPPVCALCLGLGSLVDSTKSQEQYLLFEALQTELGDLLQRPSEIFDPVFDPQDVQYLTGQGLLPLEIEHNLVIAVPTLLYMPHCPRSLFDLLLQRCWSRTGLKNLVILGNRLDMYDDPLHASASSKTKSPFISKAAPLFHIIPLPPTKDHFQAFNDLALQWISSETIDDLAESFFECASDSEDQPTSAVETNEFIRSLERVEIT